MTKYRFDELPDWARDELYTRSDHLSEYYRIKSDTNIEPGDIVYLFVRGTGFNKFDLDLMERSNYDCLLHYYPGQFVECGGHYSIHLMYPIMTTHKGKLRIPDEIVDVLDTITEYGILDEVDYSQRENEEVERQFVEYVQTIAPDIDDDATLDILTEYSERFGEYPWLEDENIVLDSQVDALIEEYVKGAK